MEVRLKHCQHGIPLYGEPSPRCPRCELVWELSRMHDHLKSAYAHRAKATQLEQEILGMDNDHAT